MVNELSGSKDDFIPPMHDMGVLVLTFSPRSGVDRRKLGVLRGGMRSAREEMRTFETGFGCGVNALAIDPAGAGRGMTF